MKDDMPGRRSCEGFCTKEERSLAVDPPMLKLAAGASATVAASLLWLVSRRRAYAPLPAADGVEEFALAPRRLGPFETFADVWARLRCYVKVLAEYPRLCAVCSSIVCCVRNACCVDCQDLVSVNCLMPTRVGLSLAY